MKYDYSIKIKVVIALAVLIAFQSNVVNSVRGINAYRKTTGNDEVTLYDRRYGRLKGILPSHGIVGYIADEKFDVKEFYLAQYALSPIILVNNTKPKLILAKFIDSSNSIRFCMNNNLIIIKKVDDNIMLYSKKAE